MTTDTERQEQQTYETVPERIAAMEATQRLLIDVVRENGRRSDENYRTLDSKMDENYKALDAKIEENRRSGDANYKALDAKFDAKIDALDAKLNAKIDRLTYLLLGVGGTVAAAFLIQLIF